jgi:hypothetical protein
MTRSMMTEEASEQQQGPTTEASNVRSFMTPLLPNNSDEGIDNSILSQDDNGIRYRIGAANTSSSGSTLHDAEHPPQQQQLLQQQVFQDHHRILDRSGDFRQSRGRWGVERLPRNLNGGIPQHQQSGRVGGELTQSSASSQVRARRRPNSWNRFCFCFCFQRVHQEWGKDWFFWYVFSPLVTSMFSSKYANTTQSKTIIS